MADSRIKPMQTVLMIAERTEQEAGKKCSQHNKLVNAEELQLQELENYAKQYLQSYSDRKIDVRAQELIAFSGFIQRLTQACKDQQAKLIQLYNLRESLKLAWSIARRKRELIGDLIERMLSEENLALDKKAQKEIDELIGQQYHRTMTR
jgi:flagellar protein FliJ